MKEETKFLNEMADHFGDGAQNGLDFVAKTGNLEKASKALTCAETAKTAKDGAAYDDKVEDGVYFITDEECDKVDARTYCKYRPDMTCAPFPTKYIGVKIGQRAIAVALEDLPGDADGELQLLPDTERCPKTSDRYSWDKERDEYRFNVFEDFDGQANTKRLKSYGCKIDLPEGVWIPSMGELGLLMMHASKINRAIELAGGKPIKSWHWSSTEVSQADAWIFNFSDGFKGSYDKCGSCAVRAVAAF